MFSLDLILISRMCERREEGAGPRPRTGRVGMRERGGWAAPSTWACVGGGHGEAWHCPQGWLRGGKGETQGGFAPPPGQASGVDTGRPGTAPRAGIGAGRGRHREALHHLQGWPRGWTRGAGLAPPQGTSWARWKLCASVFGSAGVSPSPGPDARRPQVTWSGGSSPSRRSLSSGNTQGDCPGRHVLCLMDLVVLTATASEALIKGCVEALPAS